MPKIKTMATANLTLVRAADGKGLIGHAGAVLLRRMAGRAGLTAATEQAWASTFAGGDGRDRGLLRSA